MVIFAMLLSSFSYSSTILLLLSSSGWLCFFYLYMLVLYYVFPLFLWSLMYFFGSFLCWVSKDLPAKTHVLGICYNFVNNVAWYSINEYVCYFFFRLEKLHGIKKIAVFTKYSYNLKQLLSTIILRQSSISLPFSLLQYIASI